MTAGSSDTPAIALVVAVADGGVIGVAGRLPWHLPDDLKHFRRMTMGKPVLMGRRTYESIGRALPGRRNLVLTRADTVWPGVESVQTLQAALSRLAGVEQVCVIGGADLFALTLPRAQCIYLTRVHGSMHGDTFFPLQSIAHWHESERLEHPADEQHRYPMSFLTLRRAP